MRDDVERNPLNYFLIKSLSEELVYVVLTSVVKFTKKQEIKNEKKSRQTFKELLRQKEKATLNDIKLRSSTVKQRRQ